jgi:hypothetical protein
MVLSILVVVAILRSLSKRAEAVHFSLAGTRASGDSVAGDWENPVYSQAARNVAFDNPIYDRFESLNGLSEA